MARWLAALIPLGLVGAGMPQDVPPPAASLPSTPVAATAPAEEMIDPALLETLELAPHDSRMAVPVRIGENDDYRFVIDTGAERTVISRELASRLGLGQGPRLNLVTLAGRAQVDTVTIPDIRFTRRNRRAAVIAPALSYQYIGASGLLGVDMLAGHRVEIDMVKRRMAVAPSRKRAPYRALPGEIVVRAASRLGQLVVTDADYRGARVRVVIDTGSAVSIGNMKMRQLVGSRGRPLGRLPITGVTGQQVTAEYHQIDRMRVGGLSFTNLPMAFGDLAPFHTLGLDDTPAMLLGMDAFAMFRQVDIDFANREILFHLRQDGFAIRTL